MSTNAVGVLLRADRREAGVDVELGPLEFKKPSHLALHPYGKLPAFEHEDVRLFETLAIVTYLDRVFGGSKLTPSDPVTQAHRLQWISGGGNSQRSSEDLSFAWQLR